ncbi:unnamed protein product, partial [Ceratitis capitata]
MKFCKSRTERTRNMWVVKRACRFENAHTKNLVLNRCEENMKGDMFLSGFTDPDPDDVPDVAAAGDDDGEPT